MTLDKFTAGKDAWLITTLRRRPEDYKPVQVSVLKVGRVYVTVGYFGPVQFHDRGAHEAYLVERTEYSPSMLLFPTEEAANEYIERIFVERDVRNFFSGGGIGNLSMEKLREIKRIITGGASE